MKQKIKKAVAILSMIVTFGTFVSLGGVMQVYAADLITTEYHDDLASFDEEHMGMASWSNHGAFNCVFSPDNISFDDGIMTMKIDKNTNHHYDYEYSGAEYRSLNTFHYGYYSVSMKPISNPGVVSSFFTYTGPHQGTIWDEIDIEFLGKDTTKVQFTVYADSKKGPAYLYDLGFDAAEDFHDYGFLWEEHSVTWYVDGEAVYKITDEEYAIPSTPSYLMMNVWNGADYLKSWIDIYDGTIPLEAKYDYFDYVPYDNVSDEIKAKSEALNKKTIEENGDYIDGEMDAVQTMPIDGNYELCIYEIENENWRVGTQGQYTLSMRDGAMRITRPSASTQEMAYVEADLPKMVYKPQSLDFSINYMNGYRASITAALVDSEGVETLAGNVTYDADLKGEINGNISLYGLSGNFTKVRLYINSDPNYINVAKDSYVRIAMNSFEVTDLVDTTLTKSLVTADVNMKNWSATEGQYTLKTSGNTLKVTRSAKQTGEMAYLETELPYAITRPQAVDFVADYTNGYRLAITASLVKEDGSELFLDSVVYESADKGKLTVHIPIEDATGEYTKLRLYINSNPESINVEKDAYVRVNLSDMTVTGYADVIADGETPLAGGKAITITVVVSLLLLFGVVAVTTLLNKKEERY